MPTPPAPIGFAIIGTGNIAEKHAAAIADAKDAKLVAVYSRGKEKRDAFAKKWKVDAEGDLDTLLARPDVDAITIATPSGAHLPVAKAAAAAGKHILCEKPLEVTVERTDELIAVCKQRGVILASIFQSRLNRNVQTLKDALDAGRFGKVLLVSVQMKWFRDQAYYDSGAWRGTWELDGGGALMNQSIHSIDLLCYLAGEPKWVCAAGGTLTHERIEVEDTAAAVIQFESGAVGTIEASTSCAPGFPRRMEISGARGSMVMEDDQITRWTFIDETEEDRKIQASQTDDGSGGGYSDPTAIGHEGHRRLVDDLVHAITTNSQPAIPGSEARRAVELIRGIYASMRSGQVHHFK